MKTLKTIIIAASFVAVAAVANAAGNEDLLTGIHGNTPAQAYDAGPRAGFAQDARGAFARSRGTHVRPHVQHHSDEPLIDPDLR